MIITNNEEALRVVCQETEENEIGDLVSQLENELEYSAKLGKFGIGLAAPQIGIAKKIAIIRYNDYKINLVNCHIENQYDLMMFKEEGCLSFPGRVENTMRYQEVHVRGNINFPHSFIASGLLAVVVQHELDHLNGILLPDKVIKSNVFKKNIKIKPNSKCICGSNIKYKRCCGK